MVVGEVRSYQLEAVGAVVRELYGWEKFFEEKPYLSRVIASLEDFRSGRDSMDFAFCLVIRQGRDCECLELRKNGDCLTVCQGGFVYESAQFGDIYGDWSFAIWQDGDCSGQFRLEAKDLRRLLQAGAELEIWE